jgi:hypothetical protein
MRWKDRQRQAEEIVRDSIDELAEDFNLNVPYYPEVHYAARELRFEDLGLGEGYRVDFDCLRKSCPLISDHERFVVFPGGIDNPAFLHEEATHFLHAKNSRIKCRNHSDVEIDKMLIMKEMLGFFGSLCLGERRNPFKLHPDLYTEYVKSLDFTDRLENECGYNEGQIHDYWVHKEGYNMGQMLFAEYSLGKISSGRITSLFRENFVRPGRANKVFFEVRAEIGWPLKD